MFCNLLSALSSLISLLLRVIILIYTLRSVLSGVAGVKSAAADFMTGVVRVAFDPDVTGVRELIQRIKGVPLPLHLTFSLPLIIYHFNYNASH